MYVHIFFQQCPIMYRPEFYILPTKYVKKKHAIGYIHEILTLDLTDQVISIFTHLLQFFFFSISFYNFFFWYINWKLYNFSLEKITWFYDVYLELKIKKQIIKNKPSLDWTKISLHFQHHLRIPDYILWQLQTWLDFNARAGILNMGCIRF